MKQHLNNSRGKHVKRKAMRLTCLPLLRFYALRNVGPIESRLKSFKVEGSWRNFNEV